MKKPTITIVGAGLAGCFMAILLAKRGYRVHVFEKGGPDEHKTKASKRSYDLTFYLRGVLSLTKADLWNAVKPILIPLDGSVAHPRNEAPIFTNYDFDNKPYYTVERGRLLAVFFKELARFPSITIHFYTALIAIDKKDKTITVHDKKSNTYKTFSCDVVFGADGVHSRVRNFIQEGQETLHKQEYLPWTYKQIDVDFSLTKVLGLRKNAMHVWSRKDALLVAFPNANQSFTAMLTLPKGQKTGFAMLQSEQAIRRFVMHQFPDLANAIPQISQSVLTNPEGKLVTIFTTPWYSKDFLVILGDSAHGMMPFHGQGMSAAFEDCLELVRLLDRYGPNWGKIFPLYQEARKTHTDCLADMTKKNFLRFRRHKKADYEAIHDKLELLLHRIFPKLWHLPLYILITTETDQFADIFEKHKKQRKLAKLLGISFLAKVITGGVAVIEYATDVYHRFNRH